MKNKQIFDPGVQSGERVGDPATFKFDLRVNCAQWSMSIFRQISKANEFHITLLMDSRLGSLNTKVFKAFEYFISMVCKGFQGFLNILVQWFAMQIFQRPPYECSGGKVLWKIEMNYWFSLLTFIILWQDINSNRTSYPLQTLSRAIKKQTCQTHQKIILKFHFTFYNQKWRSDVVSQQ